VQSLDYCANSYHIHLNNLKFYGYGKEISQKYPCSLQPINTSFLSTRSPTCHSPSPSSSLSGGIDEELKNSGSKENSLESSSFRLLLLSWEEMAVNFTVPEVNLFPSFLSFTAIHYLFASLFT